MAAKKYKLLVFILVLLRLGASATPEAYREDSVQVNGCWVHFYTSGAGLPIVLLQGGPGMSHLSVQPLGQLISGKLSYQNILIDFRGTGRSKAELNENNVSYDAIVTDIEAVRKKLNIKRWVVGGHSMGGQYAMYYTLCHPEAVRKLILIASADADNSFQNYFGHNIHTHLSPEMREKTERYSGVAETKKDPARAEYEAKKALITAYFYDPVKAHAFIDTLTQPAYFAMNSNACFSFFMYSSACQNFNIRDRLHQIKAPVLIIQGRQDCLGESIPIGLHEGIAGSQLWFIDECGHLPWIEQPANLINIIASFLL